MAKRELSLISQMRMAQGGGVDLEDEENYDPEEGRRYGGFKGMGADEMGNAYALDMRGRPYIAANLRGIGPMG